MTNNRTKLERLQRELDKLAPAEPVVIEVYFADDWPYGEGELGYTVTLDGRTKQLIKLHWPEDEDEEKRTRQDAPGRA